MFATLGRLERRVFAGLFVNFALFGISLTLFGAAIPEVIRAYQWSYTTTGFIVAAGALGFVVATASSGPVIGRLGTKKILVFTLILEGLCYLFFARIPIPWPNILLNFAIGFSRGQIEVATNHWVIGVESNGQSRLMNFMHSSFCIGAIAGPVGLGSLIRNAVSWQVVFPAMGALLLLMAVVIQFMVRFPSRDDTEAGEAGEGRQPDVAMEPAGDAAPARQSAAAGGTRRLHPMIAVLAATLMLYVGAELGANAWISEYFVSALSAPASLGATAVAVMWSGLLVGRLGLSIVFRGTQQAGLLLGLAALSAGSLTLVLLSTTAGLALFFLFFVGLGYSGIFPVAMSVVGRYSRGGTAVGIVTMGAGLGGLTFPFLISVVADSAGIRGGFFLCLVCAAFVTVLALVIVVKTGREDARA